MYKLQIKFNGEEHNLETDNLEESILSVRPRFVKTKIYIKVEKDGKICEKQLFFFRGKMLFRNKVFLQYFIRTLVLK